MSADIRAALRLDRSQFSRGINEAKSETKGLKDIAREVGPALASAFSVGAVTSFIHSQGQAARATLNFADAVGLSTDAVQALDSAANANGGSSEKMRAAMSKLRDVLGEAAGGARGAVDALTRLGVTQDMIQRGDMEGAIQAIARNWMAAGADAATYSDVQDVLGRGAVDLKATLDLLAQSSLPALTEAFKASGQAMSRDMLDSMNRIDNEFNDITDRAKAMGAKLVVGLSQSLGAAAALLAGYDPAGVFNYEDGQTRQLTAAERAARRDQQMREQFAADGKAFEERRNQAAPASPAAPAANHRAAEAKRKQQEAHARAIEAAQADIAKAQEAARGELSRLFAASAPHVTPAAEINRVGGFVGGQRDAKAEAAIDQRKLQQEANRITTTMQRDIADIKAQLRQNKGPAQL